MFIVAPADSKSTSKLYLSNRKAQALAANPTGIWALRPNVSDGFAKACTCLTAQALGLLQAAIAYRRPPMAG